MQIWPNKMAAGQNTRYTKSVLQGKLLQIDYNFMNKKMCNGLVYNLYCYVSIKIVFIFKIVDNLSIF